MTAGGRTVSAGVIGVGSMGRHHARVYSELPDVDLVGVADADFGCAREVAGTHDTTVRDQAELLAAVDVVSVAVPTGAHHEVVRTCIDHGVDTLVEKPFVERPAQGRPLVAAAEAADVTLQVGHIERFNPAVRTLEDILEGLDIIAVSAERLGPPPDRDITDSAVLDLMIHDLDIVDWVVDAGIDSLSAVGARDGRYASATLQFEDGVVGRLTASRVTQRRVRRLTITAATRLVVVDYTDQSVRIYRHSMPEYVEDDGNISYRHESVVERPAVPNTEPLRNELESFIRSSRTGCDPSVSGADGLRVLSLAREIERRLGEPAAAAGRRREPVGVDLQ
jgi:predicted dehydrogenase